jgi:chromosomal replication initiation ATPase DnaA
MKDDDAVAQSALACRTVRAVAARAAAIPVRALEEPGRGPAGLTRLRRLSIYLAHVELGLPAAAVARAFQRSRRSVAHACRLVEDQRDNRAFDVQITALAAAARAELVRP